MDVFVSEELCLGVIIGPHGIKGAVRVKSFTEIPESIAEYGTLHDKNGKSFDLRLDGQSKGLLIASIKGMTTRNQAEVLKGTELFTIIDIEKGINPRAEVSCEIKYVDGSSKTIKLLSRIDTENEIEYYKNGGILQYVLRNMLN